MTEVAQQKVFDFTPNKDFPLTSTCVILRLCLLCNKSYNIKMSVEDYVSWSNGALVQNAFPYLSPDQREMIINGTHSECFDKAFPE